MNRNTWSLARYRFGRTLRQRIGGYVALGLLVALLGGLAMASVAAARRTESSYPQYLAATHTSQLSGITAEFIPGVFTSGYDPVTISQIAHLPHVSHVDSVVGVNAFPLTPQGKIAHIQTDFGLTFVGALGAGPHYDQVSAISGRFPTVLSPHVFLADTAAVAKLHLHLGETLTFGVYSNAQEYSPTFGVKPIKPVRVVTAKLVEIYQSPTDLLEDDVDRSNGDLVFTPAFMKGLLSCCTDFTGTDVGVTGGPADIAAVRQAILRYAPKGSSPFTETSVTVAKVQRAIKPESIAIGSFGAIVALAALVVGGQLISRQLRLGLNESQTLRALGADPAMTTSDALLGVTIAIVIGALLGVLVAVGLSPLAPLGPVRPFDPTPGVSLDWTVLLSGVAVLIVVLLGVSLLLARRYEPRRASERAERAARGSSTLVSTVSAALPAPAAVGLGFAIEPSRGPDPVPVRSVILSAVLSVIIVMSTLIFGASINSLVSHPQLYGWNWNYELASEFGSGNIPSGRVAALLHADPDVASWSGAYFATASIDGQQVPLLGERPAAAVAPPTLSGTGLVRPGEIVLGAVTLADLHKRLGDSVNVSVSLPHSAGGTTTSRLRIVGTATLPTIGQGTELHLEMGSGAVVPDSSIPPRLRGAQEGFPGGPDVVLVRLRPGVSAPTALRRLQRIAKATSNGDNDGVVVNAVQRPAEIVNYRSLGSIPAILGATLALGTVTGLGLTLLASVRRRRRDLAMLKTLGFTKGQVSTVIACQATVSVFIGLVVGVPLGIVAGRYLWNLFANEIHAVPVPAVSPLMVTLIVVGALVLANLVALIPGRLAARTAPGVLLRAD